MRLGVGGGVQGEGGVGLAGRGRITIRDTFGPMLGCWRAHCEQSDDAYCGQRVRQIEQRFIMR